MEKKGEKRKNWKKRWFILSKDKTLKYYDSAPESELAAIQTRAHDIRFVDFDAETAAEQARKVVATFLKNTTGKGLKGTIQLADAYEVAVTPDVWDPSKRTYRPLYYGFKIVTPKRVWQV